MSEKLCPLLKSECPEEECAWWLENEIHGDGCAMKIMSEQIALIGEIVGGKYD